MILLSSCTSIRHANADETGPSHFQGPPLNTPNRRSAARRHSSTHALCAAGSRRDQADCRGLYRLAELPPPGELDLLTVAKKVSHADFCLLTALAFHRLTTQVPHAVEVALPHTVRVRRLAHPPLNVFRFSPELFNAGIESHVLNGVCIRVYSREKTMPNIFKYRNKVGIDVALEALRIYRSQPKRDFQAVLKFARICRVENVIRPYLEATA